MNRLTIVILTALAFPATASAAPLEPLPFDRAPALCLSGTGAPGGLSLLGPYSRGQSATDLLTAGGDGAARSARVQIGRMAKCASAAEAPGGAAIVAGTTVNRDYEAELRAVVRDPGGAFGEPTVLSDQSTEAVAAVGPAGHAVVVWSETRGRQHLILAARRAPGGAFGAAETLVDSRTDRQFSEVRLAATVDAAGTATVLWSRELPSDDFDEHVEVATAAPGSAFAVQRLGDGVSTSGPPSLAGAPDGWAVAAFAANGPQVFERAPGGSFQPVSLPALPGGDAVRNDVAVAVRDGGGAVLAWRVHGSPRVSGIEALTRTAAGGGWSLRRVAPQGPPVSSESSEEGFVLEPFTNPLVLPDGRAAVAWTDAAYELRHGRLHLAVEGAAPQPTAAAPRLTLRAPRHNACSPGSRRASSPAAPPAAPCGRSSSARARTDRKRSPARGSAGAAVGSASTPSSGRAP